MSNYYADNSSATESRTGMAARAISGAAIELCRGTKRVPGEVVRTPGMKKSLSATVLIATALLLVPTAAGCGPGKPVINAVKPDEGLIRTGFKISGTAFGETRRKSTVTVGGRKAPVASWSDTSIKATVPIKLTAGRYPVLVTTDGGPSNEKTYTVFATFTGSTPLPAMLEFLKNRKIDTKDMTFSVVATSKIDPSWKLDKAEKEGEPTYYFLFRETADGWTLIDFGTGFTAEQMRTVGAPSDLKPPT